MDAPKRTDKGVKEQQRSDDEDRTLEFRKWHRELEGYLATVDIDMIEWRDGKPAALLEITRVDGGIYVTGNYLASIINRFRTQLQGKAARVVAEALGCKAYIVLYRQGLTQFWLYNWTDDCGWEPLTQYEMARFLRKLPNKGEMPCAK